MLRMLAALTAVLAFLTTLAAANDEAPGGKAKATLKPLQFSVFQRVDGKDFPAYGRSEQTHTQFLVTLPGRQLLWVDQASKLTLFADDKGTSLINPKDTAPPSFAGSITSKAGDSMLIGVNSYSRVPAEGATRVLLKGDLVLVCGLDEKSTPEVTVDFKAKGEVKLGALTLRVDPKKSNPNQPYFELAGEAQAIKTLTVVGADGKEVPAFATYSRDVSDGPRTHKYVLRNAIGEGKVRASYYSKEEKVTIPVDLAFGPGL